MVDQDGAGPGASGPDVGRTSVARTVVADEAGLFLPGRLVLGANRASVVATRGRRRQGRKCGWIFDSRSAG